MATKPTAVRTSCSMRCISAANLSSLSFFFGSDELGADARVQLGFRTAAHAEAAGLFEAHRSDGGHRRYSRDQVRVLRRVAELLRQHSRTGDEVFRWYDTEALVGVPAKLEKDDAELGVRLYRFEPPLAPFVI